MAAALLGVLGLIGFSVLRSGMLLSGQNTNVNLSAARSRQMIDWIGERTRYALGQPSLLTAAGAASASLSDDGILVKTFGGAPYVVKEAGGSFGDIASTAKQFTLEYRPDLPEPVVGDWMQLDTVEQAQLEISAVSSLSAGAGITRRLVTTVTTLNETAKPSMYRVSASLYRKQAFIFVPTETGTNARSELRHYKAVRNGMSFSTAANYKVLANGYRKLNSQAYFTSTTIDGEAVTVLRAMVHSTGKAEYVERGKAASTFSTIPIQLRLWALSR